MFIIKRISLIIVIGLVAVISYSNSFNGPFHFDDLPFIAENQTIRDVGDIGAIWKGVLPQHSRFVVFYTFALNYHFHKLDVFGYHVSNLVIHIISSLLVWWFVALLIDSPGINDERIVKNKHNISFFAALLFVCHPVQTQAVVYISQRFASLATMFYLLAICMYLHARGIRSRSKIVWFVGSSFAALLSMFTKEIAITIPIMLLVIEIMLLNPQMSIKDQLLLITRNNRWVYCFLILIFLLIIPQQFDFSIKSQLFSEKISNSHDGDVITFASYFVTQFRVAMTFIRLLFIPIYQNVDYDFVLSKSIFEPAAFFSFLAFILILGFGIFYRSKNLLVSFGIIWIFVTFLPNFIPRADVIFEHKLYLISVGFYIVVVTMLFKLIKDPKIVILILCLLTIAYSKLTYQRNKVWNSEVSLWEDIAKKSPKKWRVHYNLGSEYSILGKNELALRSINESIRLNPVNADSYNNRGNIYARTGMYAQALRNYDKAIEFDSKNAKAFNNRGSIYRIKGMFDLALADYDQSIRLDENYAFAYYNRSIILKIKGDHAKAYADAIKAKMLGRNIENSYLNELKDKSQQ
ncbi:MAG: tetratricopeptide repeat protein [Candidatus Omnitrophica bacterium]|nr:tetratricopeptide repeat protein [Candidatus Omnitrophota bacterium]MBU1996639.1 tetratricopeptide repeat protein [Candidatus Omnitrophota bacterium]MBU4333149.1 tetratricopeptide repeat protein [Candidatus Omnitrophota bacterium]